MGQVSLHGKHLLGLQHATPEEIKFDSRCSEKDEEGCFV